MNPVAKVKKTIVESNMIEKGDRVIAAVSGGPDSVFLLYALNELRHDLSIDLLVAHFNHKLRKNSGSDERFAASLAQSWQLPFFSASRNILRRKPKGSLEEVARQARFQFLAETAKKTRADKIALGHTQDDLAETVLMRLLRGTGLYGLRAICPIRVIGGATFIRPLLQLIKKDIVTFLKSEKISYRVDPTNRKPDFLRNKIRLKLLPELTKVYNPAVTKALANLAEIASFDYEYLEGETQRVLQRLRPVVRKRHISFPFSKLNKIHPSLQRMVFRTLYEKLSGSTRRLTFEHIDAVEKLFSRPFSQARVLLPNGIFVMKKGGKAVFARRNS